MFYSTPIRKLIIEKMKDATPAEIESTLSNELLARQLKAAEKIAHRLEWILAIIVVIIVFYVAVALGVSL